MTRRKYFGSVPTTGAAPTYAPCPANCGRPSRTAVRYRSKTALCRECYDTRRAAHTARWLALRSKNGRRVSPVTDDIPPDEIERLFTEALAQIRSRRTWPSLPRS
jgi:hypothetical protein